MGQIPPLQFVKDLSEARLQRVEQLLSQADMGDDHERTDLANSLKDDQSPTQKLIDLDYTEIPYSPGVNKIKFIESHSESIERLEGDFKDSMNIRKTNEFEDSEKDNFSEPVHSRQRLNEFPRSIEEFEKKFNKIKTQRLMKTIKNKKTKGISSKMKATMMTSQYHKIIENYSEDEKDEILYEYNKSDR